MTTKFITATAISMHISWRRSLFIAANQRRPLSSSSFSGRQYAGWWWSSAPFTSPRPNANNNATTIQNHHQRHISLAPKPRTACPFRTLNIPKDSTYAHAKKSFLKIAMHHHPDVVGDECEETQQKSQDIFMKCRTALEKLVECDDTGKCLLRSEVEEIEARSMSNEEFDSWFEKETGHQNPFQFDLDPSVMREVASMHDDMEGSHGLDRDGGMWHLASMISSAVKTGKDGAESILKLEAGSVREGENVEAKGKLERRRKRARRRR
ncbi:hypothetical protein ACHAXR_003349 [Thalassiosira sp. AJA248-18]